MLYFQNDIKAKVLKILLSSAGLEESVQECIAYIGKQLDVSRVYIFENTADNTAFSNTFEWCNEGIPAEIQNLQNVRYVEDLGDVYQDNFNEEGIFYCSDIKLLPKPQYEILAPQGIKAMLQCAIVENGMYKGMVGFDDCVAGNRNWHSEPEKIETIAFLAHMLSIYLLKERHLERIAQEQEELREMAKRAELAKEEKSRFLDAVSHDMRTPLNGILGLVNIIKDRVDELECYVEEKEFDDCKNIISSLNTDIVQLKSSGKFLLNLINDTLDVSKLENGRFALHPVVCNALEESVRFTNMIWNVAQPKNITITLTRNARKDLEWAEDMLSYIDPLRISQLFFNIVGNSVKFSKDNSAIDVTLESIKVENNALWKRFIIRDYGIGMSEAFIEKIFIPFEQEKHSGETVYQGTGLGMTIVKQLIDSMGGTISISSKEHEGTTITIDLPLPFATKEQIAHSNQKSSDAKDVMFSGMRVLLCEDNLVNIKVSKNYLEKKGLLVEAAKNGKIGLDMFTASSVGYYDFILMDIRMPVMDGLEATKNIRNSSHEEAKNIPIIALSANITPDKVDEAMAAGINYYLSKPVEAEELYALISKGIRK